MVSATALDRAFRVRLDGAYGGLASRGEQERGAAGKVPVFGLLKRGGKVYAKVIPNVKGPTLKAILDTKVVPDSIVYSDTLSSYNVLDVSSFKHYRINHSKLFSDQKNHIIRKRPMSPSGFEIGHLSS